MQPAGIDFNLIPNLGELLKNVNNAYYVQKAATGKYAREAAAIFAPLFANDEPKNVEARMNLFEALKVINLSIGQTKEYDAKKEGWKKGFEQSAPIRRLEDLIKLVTGICERCGLEKGKVVSAGAFMQAFESKYKEVAFGIMYLVPIGKSITYSYGPYMLMDFDAALSTVKYRTSCCITTYLKTKAAVAFDYAKIEDAQPGSNYAIELTKAIDAVNKLRTFLPDKKEVDDYGTEAKNFLLSKLAGDEGSDGYKLRENFTVCIAGAYMVTFQYILQSKSVRRKMATPQNYAAIRGLINVVLVAGGKPKMPEEPQNLKPSPQAPPAWFVDYFKVVRAVSMVCRSVRRVVNGGANNDSNNPVRKTDHMIA